MRYIYAGIFFLSLAFVSDFCGLAGVTTVPPFVTQSIFFLCLLLASWSFALSLVRVSPQDADASQRN